VPAKLASGSATVSDVAKLAGVSTATVSRALNTPEIVSPEVRERVVMAVEKLGYVPNDSARALRQNQTRLIGVIVPTLSYALYADFFASLQSTLYDQGFFALLTTNNYDLDFEAEQATKLIRQGAQGLVLVGRLRDKKLASMLASSQIPYVCTYTTDPLNMENCVGFDNAKAIEGVVHHLASLGHRRVAMLSGSSAARNDRAMARIHGFTSAMTALGLTGKEWIEEAPYTIEGGRSALQRVFAKGWQPTAVVCGSDMLAIGALQQCLTIGLAVPRDLSVVGFDDLEITSHLEPPLTTVAVPSVALGKAAGDRIVALCRGLPLPPSPAFETRLIVRNSTSPPPDD